MSGTPRHRSPARCDVLVVGGGVTGAATAYELARGGADVVLAERGDLNAEASGRNAGSLHAQLQHDPFVTRGETWARAFAPATALLLAAIERWRELEGELGVDLEVAVTGGVLVAADEAQLRAIERKVAIERAQGLDSRLLTRSELQDVAPYVSDRMVGGELCANEGKASPLLAPPALARAAAAHGARVWPYTDVEAIARERDGFRVATSAGELLARQVVSCAGVDAGRVTGLLGTSLPIAGEAFQTSVTEPVAPLVTHLVYFAGERLTLKQARAGTLLIGGGWPARVGPDGRATLDPASLAANLRVALDVVPAIASARVVRTWTGVCNATADWLPLIGELDGVPGAFVGSFPYLGFTAGPLVGRLLADLVLDRTPTLDLSPFAPGRRAS